MFTVIIFIDTCYWRKKDGYYVDEGSMLASIGHGNECYATLKKAQAKCAASGDCKAVVTQNNICNGNFRVTHGGPKYPNYPTFKYYTNWKRYGMISYERYCEKSGNQFMFIIIYQGMFVNNSWYIAIRNECSQAFKVVVTYYLYLGRVQKQ